MTAITTYATLVSNIQALAEDDGTEFSDYIPTAIALAEDRLFRELELPELETKATGNLTTSTSTLTKPTGYEFCEHFIVSSGTTKVPLKKKSDSFVQDYWPDTSVTGVPKYYTDSNATEFYIVPTPTSNYAYEIRYTKKPTKLSSGNTTNYFVDNVPEALFAASMVEMVKFMKAWSQVPIFEADFRNAQESWNIQMMRYRRDGEKVPQAVDSGPNSLKHTVTTKA